MPGTRSVGDGARVDIMPPQLVALTEGPNILLDKPILLLGRHQECDIQLSSRKVSRRHCCIAQVDDYLVVRDLGSTNGIRINGARVQEGSLRPGDELTIGSHRYQVKWNADSNGPGRLPVDPTAGPAVGKHASGVGSFAESDDMGSFDEPLALPDPRKNQAASVADASLESSESSPPPSPDPHGESASLSDILPMPQSPLKTPRP